MRNRPMKEHTIESKPKCPSCQEMLDGVSAPFDDQDKSPASDDFTICLCCGAHGAYVYDYNGQNICVSDCLTVEPNSDEIRTLIYYADGKLMFDRSGSASIGALAPVVRSRSNLCKKIV